MAEPLPENAGKFMKSDILQEFPFPWRLMISRKQIIRDFHIWLLEVQYTSRNHTDKSYKYQTARWLQALKLS